MTATHKAHHLPQINIADPLYRLLNGRLRLRLVHMLILWIVINIIMSLVIPFFHHRTFQHNLFANPGIQDVQIWLVSFIGQPIIVYVYWRSVSMIPQVFVSLHENRVISPRSNRTVTQFLHELEARMTSTLNTILITAIVIFAILLFHRFGWSAHRDQGTYGSFPYNDFQQFVLMTVHGFLRFSFIGWSVARGLIFVDALRDWWRDFDVEIKPFHSDGAGGLSAIGDTTLLSGLLVGASGLFLGSTIIVNIQSRLGSTQLFLLLTVLATLILVAPLAFIIPIWSTHNVMRQARQKQLDTLTASLTTQWETIHGSQGTVDETSLVQLAGMMHLREVTVKSVPVWPFGGGDFGRYSLSLAPLWSIIVYILLQVIFPNLISGALQL